RPGPPRPRHLGPPRPGGAARQPVLRRRPRLHQRHPRQRRGGHGAGAEERGQHHHRSERGQLRRPLMSLRLAWATDPGLEREENAGMGSTVVLAAIKNQRLGLLNVGDSPAYLVRSGIITEIYQNHSWPSEQARAGIIAEEEVANHPMKHRLARAVGVWDQVKAFTNELELEVGDVVVLCSDGVEEAGVTPDELRKLMEN